MNDLRDLLKYEIMDLYSAEEQIIKALPAMIKKAKNPELKQALQQHLKITENHRNRLDQVQRLLTGEGGGSGEGDKGLLARLFRRSQTCKGMEGIIDEAEKIMAEDISPEVLDAAIIGSAQKVEHYEICGYGTARAYAQELGLTQVADLLEQTLDEEYEADERLTSLAVTRLNERAEKAGSRRAATSGTSRSMTGTTGGTGRSSTETSRQRAPREEMEMASSKRGSTAGSKTTAARTTGATKGTTGSTRSTSESRGAATGRGTGNNTSASKGTTSKGSQSAGNRGGTTGRGSTSGGRS